MRSASVACSTARCASFALVEQFDAASAAQEVATIYLQKQLYGDALRVLENVKVRVPSLFLHTVARVLSGEASAARETADAMVQMDRHSVFTLMGQVLVRRLEGQETEPLLVSLREIDTGNCEVHCWLAQVHAFAGDEAAAVDRLSRAVMSGYFNAPYMASDPLLESARANSQIQVIIDIARRRHEQFEQEFDERRGESRAECRLTLVSNRAMQCSLRDPLAPRCERVPQWELNVPAFLNSIVDTL